MLRNVTTIKRISFACVKEGKLQLVFTINNSVFDCFCCSAVKLVHSNLRLIQQQNMNSHVVLIYLLLICRPVVYNHYVNT